jgi:hypothetical protein
MVPFSPIYMSFGIIFKHLYNKKLCLNKTKHEIKIDQMKGSAKEYQKFVSNRMGIKDLRVLSILLEKTNLILKFSFG